MPELPEVTVVAKELKEILVKPNLLITKLNLYSDKSLRNKTKAEFENLSNIKILDVYQIGKNLILKGDTKYLILHLRMEGNFNLINKEKLTTEDFKHTIASFELNSNNFLLFNDHRKFATIDLFENNNQINDHSFFKNLGPEPWDLDLDTFYDSLKNKKSAIKTSLLSQKYLSGLGNIYVDEVLFLSKIHPKEQPINLSKSDFQNILFFSIKVLKDSINEGGSTIKTFKSFGQKGNYQNKLLVHQRKGLPCKNCGTIILKMIVNGRGTYFCPIDQKLK